MKNIKAKLEKTRSKKAHSRQPQNERLDSSLVKHLEESMVKPGGYVGKRWYPNTDSKKSKA